MLVVDRTGLGFIPVGEIKLRRAGSVLRARPRSCLVSKRTKLRMSSDESSTNKVWISDQDDSRQEGAALPDQFGLEGVEETDSGAGAGAGGAGRAGGGGGGSGGSGGESGGSDAALPIELLAILNAAGRSPGSLPQEVLEALTAGRANAKHLENFLRIDSTPLLGPLAKAFTGLRDRLVLNMRFWMVVCVELAIGFGSKTFVEVKVRGERFWKEFDFYLSDIALELVGDFALVWLLSPAMRFAGPPAAGSFSHFIEGVPKHALQLGSYALWQRLFCIVYKGLQFGSVGFFASLIGHSATKALVDYRKKMNPEEESQVKLAPVLQNSLWWGFFMMISSAPRYQLVNAWEQRIVDRRMSNIVVATIATFTVRLLNCGFGGEHWLVMAKQLGLQ
ncbi:hypothetical protein NDN08_000362 [Rhodosorus marinus]|uniref:Uncharacterized protein n=1 Tax=Rhodosorus marinus TaxID=101924 RepID=A0AAV8UMQ0_9RHOD|nr:hypothetical protein NDN08_000362 [Rhodosorus marinus]